MLYLLLAVLILTTFILPERMKQTTHSQLWLNVLSVSSMLLLSCLAPLNQILKITIFVATILYALALLYQYLSEQHKYRKEKP